MVAARTGHTGNTSQAAFSPDQLVQVLSPNGLEKLEQGQQVSLKWRTAGIVDPAGGYADTILADQPAAYFRLGESPGATTAKDASGNGHGGNYNGSFTLGSAGSMPAELDTAINFTGGGGYVSVPDAPELRPTQLTVEAWVKPDSTLGSFGGLDEDDICRLERRLRPLLDQREPPSLLCQQLCRGQRRRSTSECRRLVADCGHLRRRRAENLRQRRIGRIDSLYNADQPQHRAAIHRPSAPADTGG